MKLLVTGAGGFISHAVASEGHRAGDRVIGLSRFPLRDTVFDEIHTTPVGTGSIAALIEKFAPDVIFHGAGTASVAASFADEAADRAVSVGTWETLLDAVLASGTRPVIVYPSSAAVYGEPKRLPISEDAEPAPISPYGTNKLRCEDIAQQRRERYGLSILCCRYFSVFGSAQRRLLIWDLYTKLHSGQRMIRLRGMGSESRDFLFVDDLAAATLALARIAVEQADRSGAVINVASGSETHIWEMAAIMQEVTCKTEPEVIFEGHHSPGDPSNWCADISRLQSVLQDWEPMSLRAGLEKTIAVWDASPNHAGVETVVSHRRSGNTG